MVEVMKIMATFFKRPHAGNAALGAPKSAAGHPPTHASTAHSRASPGQSLVGSLPHPLGPDVHKLWFVPVKSLRLQSCVNSGSPVVELTVGKQHIAEWPLTG